MKNHDWCLDVARVIAVHGYRNSKIEDFHAEGRLSDADMKVLNKEIHSQIYTILYGFSAGRLPEELFHPDWGHDWDPPVLIEGMLKPRK